MLNRKLNVALLGIALTGFGIAHADTSGPDEPIRPKARNAQRPVTKQAVPADLRSFAGQSVDASNEEATTARHKASESVKSTQSVLDRFDTSLSN